MQGSKYILTPASENNKVKNALRSLNVKKENTLRLSMVFSEIAFKI